MRQAFRHLLWKREVIVDDQGISEHRKGNVAVFVPWDQVVELDRYGVRASSGDRISVRLTPRRQREFFECASKAWRELYPERWTGNRNRLNRQADRAVYVMFPLLLLGPPAFCYTVYVILYLLGCPEGSFHQQLREVHGLAVMGLIAIAVLWTWYGYAARKAAKQGGPEKQDGK